MPDADNGGNATEAANPASTNAPGMGAGELTQEIRFAVAMSGGVSLAVWMGGVAREINLLQQASNVRVNESRNGGGGQAPMPPAGPSSAGERDWDDRCRDLYGRLLRLLDVRVTADVLSGTSAGGINAALLGLSSAAGVDLAAPARADLRRIVWPGELREPTGAVAGPR
jgi:hypothetical protein